MHVKYASRHALYPVPNVFDAVAVVVPARAGVRAARDIDAAATVVAPLRAVRALFAAVALRAVVLCTVFRAVRAVVFVVARVAVRDCAAVVAAVRTVTVPARGVAVRASPRDETVCAEDVVVDWRFMLDASRTAALATPMPTASVPTKSKNFFIIIEYMISKSAPRGNGYLRFFK